MSAPLSSRKIILLIVNIFLILALTGCSDLYFWMEPDREEQPPGFEMEQPDQEELPPGSDATGGESASANEPVATPAESENSAGSSELPLKPVRFSNSGTLAYTVSVWNYTPPDPSQPSTPSNASTVASPGGNPSSYLSLPLGTYTWCYHWDLGDVDGDGMRNYAHTFDGRPVVLDESDSDVMDFAEMVTLSAPTGAGDTPGTCLESANPGAVVSPRPPIPNGELLFTDDGNGGAEGMFPPEFMEFAYQGGQAALTANAPNFVLPAMYSGQAYGDSIIEVDITGFSGTGTQMCIIFRSDDVDGGLTSYNIMALIPGSRAIEFAVWRDGWTQSMVQAIADESISLAAPIRFRLEAKGSEYVAFINGKFAAGFIDSQITSAGIMGMSITVDAAQGSFSYDNLKIYSVP